MHHMGRILPVLLALTLFSGCSGVKKLRELDVKSCRLESLSPKGFTSAKVILSAEVDNPGTALDISGVEGVVYNETSSIALFEVEDLNILARTQDSYQVSVLLSLDKGVSIMKLLKLAGTDLNSYKVDFQARLKPKGAPALKVNEKGVAVKDLAQFLGL